jgi:TPR repeat protein
MYEDLLRKGATMPTHLSLALYEVAMAHSQGWGTKQDKEKAAYHFQLAANLGDTDAQVALGECFLRQIVTNSGEME